jgi:hypothetical protein
MLYVNTPSIALSQPDATHIALAEVNVEFAKGRAKYKARTIEIPRGDAPVWFYVAIEDPDYLGDRDGMELRAFAEPTHDKCGVDGFIYMGALKTGCDPIEERVMPGGWPAPVRVAVGR